MQKVKACDDVVLPSLLSSFFHREEKGKGRRRILANLPLLRFLHNNDPENGEARFRLFSAYILSSVMLGLLLLSIFVNLSEQNYGLLIPLGLAAFSPLLSLAWLSFGKAPAMKLELTMIVTLMILGAYLLLVRGAPEGSSLLWFVIFPPMVMFSLGLRNGSIMFLLFFVFIGSLLYTPLQGLMSHPLPGFSRVRLMLTLLGAFLFSLGTEYNRYRTYRILENAMVRLEHEALTDPLTGLGNRRSFQSYLEWIMARCVRDAQPYSLVMIDIDHFKSINDHYGHETGDKVLRHIADCMGSRIRASDRLFRWGGEEFVLIMPGSDIVEARRGAERLRSHLAKQPFMEGGERIICTASMGIYSGVEAYDAEKPVQEADANLYEAKSSGRNKVVG